MNPNPKQLSLSSLITAGIAFLAVPIGMSFIMPQDAFRMFFLIALLTAMTSVVLGITGIVQTRGEPLGHRIPAILAIGIGGVLTVLYSLIFWLSTPF